MENIIGRTRASTHMLDANRHVITALHAHHKLVDGGINGPTAAVVNERAQFQNEWCTRKRASTAERADITNIGPSNWEQLQTC
jgi:hypothetical protein